MTGKQKRQLKKDLARWRDIIPLKDYYKIEDIVLPLLKDEGRNLKRLLKRMEQTPEGKIFKALNTRIPDILPMK